MVDRPKTSLDEMAERIVEIAPSFAEIKSVDDVDLKHIAYLTFALDVELGFRLKPRES